jgi:hypothetical protein
MGSGNFSDAHAGFVEAQQFAALNAAGAKACRMNIYPYTYYWAGKKATPERLDAAVLQAHAAGVTPMLLFEYYTRFDTPVGDYAVWHEIGNAFASRFMPNSAWWLTQGIKNYGITIYSAFNEPDIDKPLLAPKVYHDALKGLADGVHAANPLLKVVPGGIAAPNSQRDFTSAGLGSAIADLLNDGTLDGVDIHDYNGRWAPLSDHNSSAQYYFDAVKKAWGVTRDINFYTTEFNYQQATPEGSDNAIGDSAAAGYLLTMTWDILGVVGNSGTSVTKLAFCWNLFDTMASDNSYGSCTTLSPWQPTARGAAYSQVAHLTSGMTIVAADPYKSGSYILASRDKKMWVWQDRVHWTNIPGAACTLTGVPKGAKTLQVYGWDGLRKTIPLHGAATVEIDNLPGNETYMFMTDKGGAGKDVGTMVRATD